MHEYVVLSRSDCGLLAARFSEHGNSQRRMLSALEEAAADDAFARLCTLRQMEKHFAVDLGMLCHHFQHRNDESTHPIERAVMNYVAVWNADANGVEELRVRIDRVREVRDIVEERRLIGEDIRL
ncbi:MAG TPA: hypothetical protein VGD49_11210 [Longimicrobiales bacterium]